MNIITRLNQHNSGNGSEFTTELSLRPWALFAYVCGFDGDMTTRMYFARRLQIRRAEERYRGMICMKQIARLASGIIHHNRDYHPELRLVLLFSD